MATATTNAAPSSPAAETTTQPVSQRETTSIDDQLLPKSVVVRIAKSVLPDNTMIQKEAVTALVKSATVFINYLAATANDVTQQKGKKTINNEEILSALELVDLDHMIPSLKAHIERTVFVALEVIVEFEIVRKEKRKKTEQDEDGRKKRKLENEIAVETNGDEGDTEIEKASDEGDSADDRDEQDEEADEEEDVEGEVDAEEPEGEGSELPVDMDEHDEISEEEDSDEALAEDSD